MQVDAECKREPRAGGARLSHAPPTVPSTHTHPQNSFALIVTFENDSGANEHLAGQGDRLEIILRAASRSSEVQTLTSDSREQETYLLYGLTQRFPIRH